MSRTGLKSEWVSSAKTVLPAMRVDGGGKGIPSALLLVCWQSGPRATTNRVDARTGKELPRLELIPLRCEQPALKRCGLHEAACARTEHVCLWKFAFLLFFECPRQNRAPHDYE